jgi:transposase
MGINIAMSVFIGMVCLLFYATYKVKKQRQKDFDDLVEREVKEREENPDLFVKDNDQVWIEYMGMRLPFLSLSCHDGKRYLPMKRKRG